MVLWAWLENAPMAPHRRQASEAVNDSQPSLWWADLPPLKGARLFIRPFKPPPELMPVSHRPFSSFNSLKASRFTWPKALSLGSLYCLPPSFLIQKYHFILICRLCLQTIYISNPITDLCLSLTWLVCYWWMVMVQHSEDLSLNCIASEQEDTDSGPRLCLMSFLFLLLQQITRGTQFEKRKRFG